MDNVSSTINYASAGNPSNWFNGTDYTNLTWTQGRRLSSVTKGSDTYTYEYDMSGVRSVKVANGLRHEYVTQNGRVVREKVTNDSTGAFQYMLDFVYDESGHPFLMRRYYNEAQTSYNTYHYVLNAQGDVIKLLHGPNTTVAEYSYDAWGNILTATGSLADVNPLRYRGYYYDQDTGFYYLQSRYYDPVLCRFINADSYASTGQGFLGYNMFAYCNNGPVNRADPSGASWLDVLIKFIKKVCSYGKTKYGSAKPYREYDDCEKKPEETNYQAERRARATRPNCYAYAIGGYEKGINPGEISGSVQLQYYNTLETVASGVEADVKALGRTIRRIDGPNGALFEDEYRIALRVGTKSYRSDMKVNDYHFMVQTETGQWAEKHGSWYGSVLHGMDETPDTISWDLDTKGYYDSEIIYYAIGG